jgi:nitrilase
MESRTTEPGTKLEVCDSPVGKLGLSICYDMRFSEMYVDLVKMGAQILLAPSAFTVPTGKAHWHTLLRGETVAQKYVML